MKSRTRMFQLLYKIQSIIVIAEKKNIHKDEQQNEEKNSTVVIKI